MYKYIYPLIKWKIKPWLKYYIVKKGEGTPSEIITSASPITLVNSLRKKFIKFIVGGNSIQDGEPSPTNEVPIKNVTGNVEVKIENQENIIPTKIDEWEQGTITASNGNLQDSTTRIRTKKFIELKSHKYYGKIQNQDYCFLNVMFYNENETYLGSYDANVSVINGESEIVLNFPTNVYKIKVLIRNKNNTTDITPSEILAIKPLIVEDYDNYEEQTAIFPLAEGMEMCKIGDYADKFVKQEDKWYKKKIINKELIKPVNGAIEANGIRLGVNLTKPVAGYPTLLCSFFQTGRNYAECVNSNSISPNRLGLNASGVVLCNASGYTTVEEYLNLFTNNDIYVYYPLLEPIYEEITDQALIAQLDKIDSLHSYKGTTYISSTNDPSPIFEVQYYMEGE